jgi:predicted alpha/beta superfamily hydrolase
MKMKPKIIKRVIVSMTLITAMLAAAGCNKEQSQRADPAAQNEQLEGSESVAQNVQSENTDPAAQNEQSEWKNHMTQRELAESVETEFQLLDKPWEKYTADTESEYDHLKEKVCLGSEYGALVYGKPCFPDMLPEGYDGGAGEIVFLYFKASTSETLEHKITFENYEDLKAKLRAEIDAEVKEGYPSIPADEDYNTLTALYDAIMADRTEVIDQRTFEAYCNTYYSQKDESSTEDSMYWQMDEDKVRAINDSIHEYHFYDEELDQSFVVHVTLPPAYDPVQTYPALVMTDAVWRFNDVVSLYDAMKEGKAAPEYLITIGFEYDVDGWDNEVRADILCDHKKEFLDFITDNMMPYLSETYKFDAERSTLFGHSQGGVFTHYAAFNYDRYENKPFKNYIIGSPTFWTPYFTEVNDYDEYKTEYGFFDRQDSYDRNLLITAGDQEDQDYKEYYGDNDSTLEGVEHLRDRLNNYGIASYDVKIYNSHHYQYVPEMLLEYISD